MNSTADSGGVPTIRRAYRRSWRALTSRWGSRALRYVLMTLLAIPFIGPLWWMISSSFKNTSEIFAFPPTLFPETWLWQNFVEVFRFQPFGRQFFNSMYIALVVTLGTVIASSVAGYSFARIRFPGNNLLFVLLLTSLMMPAEVTIVPNFRFMQFLQLTDSHVPLILLPILTGNGVMATFMMRQYYLSLPRDVEESAMIDGLNRAGILRYIALPIAKPALASVAILAFLFSWNLFLEPLIFIDTLTKFTVPVALRGFTDSYGYPMWDLQLAATTLSVLPVLLFYILAQRQVVESLSFSGIKG
jgi:multiple sugar transport system permease protein